MDENFETILNKCNLMDDIQNESKTDSSIIDKLHISLQPTIEKEEPFSIFKAATKSEINELWNYILNIDDTFTQEIQAKKQLKNQVRLKNIAYFIFLYN